MSDPQHASTKRIRLESWAALKISGVDAEMFLQGQLSADVAALRADRAVLSSYNSPKGRVLALPLLMRRDDGFALWLPTALVESVSKRLRMFVMRSKVTIEPMPDAAMGVLGQKATDWLSAQGLPAPEQCMELANTNNGLRIMRCLREPARYFVSGTLAEITALADQSEELDWRRAEISAGMPVVYPQTQDRWVAQMLNLDQLPGGISFKKGCYTGQEVIARLHYLGKLKKQMFIVHGSGDAPAPGTSICLSDGDGQSVGDIVDACTDTDHGFVACAVLQVAAATSENLTLDREHDRVIKLRPT